MRRIGELSAAMDKAKPAGGKGKVVLPTTGSTKSEALAAAGISTQAASRCEHLAKIDADAFEGLVEERKADGKSISAREIVAKVQSGVKQEAAVVEAADRPRTPNPAAQDAF
jgi:hypothetical protein